MTEVFFVFGKGEARFLKELLSMRFEKALEGGVQKILTITAKLKNPPEGDFEHSGGVTDVRTGSVRLPVPW